MEKPYCLHIPSYAAVGSSPKTLLLLELPRNLFMVPVSHCLSLTWLVTKLFFVFTMQQQPEGEEIHKLVHKCLISVDEFSVHMVESCLDYSFIY